MRGYCKATGDTELLDRDTCSECDESDCEYNTNADTRLIEKLKSSEFAADILKRLSVIFAVPEAEVACKLDRILSQMKEVSLSTMEKLIQQAVQAHIARTMDEKIEAMLQETFNKALVEKIMVVGADEKTLITTVQQRISDQIKVFLNSEAKNRGYSERSDITKQTMDEIISRVLTDKVDVALEELKEEAIEKFNKAAMKKLMEGMAKAIGQDRRLLAIMGAAE